MAYTTDWTERRNESFSRKSILMCDPFQSEGIKFKTGAQPILFLSSVILACAFLSRWKVTPLKNSYAAANHSLHVVAHTTARGRQPSAEGEGGEEELSISPPPALQIQKSNPQNLITTAAQSQSFFGSSVCWHH